MVRIRFPPPASQQQTVPALGFDGATDSPKSLSQEPDRWFESRSLQQRVGHEPHGQNRTRSRPEPKVRIQLSPAESPQTFSPSR